MTIDQKLAAYEYRRDYDTGSEILGDRYFEWCEEEKYDPDDYDTEAMWLDYLDDLRAEAAIERYEMAELYGD